jgi:hypothetical protein
MNGFDLAYERSLALHRRVAERVVEDPGVLERAQALLTEWRARGGRSQPLLDRWAEVLGGPTDEVVAFLTARTEEAAWLRSASPFAGCIPPREREAILREVAARTGVEG